MKDEAGARTADDDIEKSANVILVKVRAYQRETIERERERKREEGMNNKPRNCLSRLGSLVP